MGSGRVPEKVKSGRVPKMGNPGEYRKRQDPGEYRKWGIRVGIRKIEIWASTREGPG